MRGKIGKAWGAGGRRAMSRIKVVLLGLVLVLVTAALACGLALAAPWLDLEAWTGAAIGVVAGASLAAGVVWGALARPGKAALAGPGRLRRLGSRLAKGETGPDGKTLPLTARTAVAMTDAERRQHLPGALLSCVRAVGETLEGGRSAAWEVHYFSENERQLLRLQVGPDARDAGAYRVTAEVDDVGRWLDTMAPDKRAAAWEGLLVRNLKVPPKYADSTAVAAALPPPGRDSEAGAPPRRIRSMSASVARPTLEWTPTVFWIVETEEGRDRSRYYCDVVTTEVLRSEQLP